MSTPSTVQTVAEILGLSRGQGAKQHQQRASTSTTTRDFFNDYFDGAIDQNSTSETLGKEPQEQVVSSRRINPIDSKADLINTIRNGVIGSNDTILTPFGRRKLTYCDYTASGKLKG